MTTYYARNTQVYSGTAFDLSAANGATEAYPGGLDVGVFGAATKYQARVGDGPWTDIGVAPSGNNTVIISAPVVCGATPGTVQWRYGGVQFAEWVLPPGVAFIAGNAYALSIAAEHYTADGHAYAHWGSTATQGSPAVPQTGSAAGTLALPTMITSGAFGGRTLGADKYGAVIFEVSGITGAANLKVRRKASAGGTATNDTANMLITEPSGSGNGLLVVDVAPMYGTPSIGLLATAYYDVQHVSASGTDGLSAEVSVTRSVDKTAIRTAKLAKITADFTSHGVYTGVVGEYSVLLALAYRYALSGTTSDKDDLLAQLTASDSALGSNHWYADANYIYRDITVRWALFGYVASLLARTRDTATANSILTFADRCMSALLSLPTASYTYHGWPAQQNGRVQNHAYSMGDIVKNAAGTRQYRCTTAGTSANVSDPSDAWSTTAGDTITDGTAVWTCDSVTRTVLPHRWALADHAANGTYGDCNQDSTVTAACLLLWSDALSAHHNSTTAKALGEAHLDFLVRAQDYRGGPQYSDPAYNAAYGAVDTGYARFALFTAAMTKRITGTAYSRLGEWLSRSVAFFGGYYNDPTTATGLYNAAHYSWVIDAVEMLWQHLAFGLLGQTDPVGDVAFTTLFNDQASDSYGTIQLDGVRTGDTQYSTGRELYDWFLYDGIMAALIAAPRMPSALTIAPSGSSIVGTFTSNATDASSIVWCRKVDGGAWSAETQVDGANLATFTDPTPGAWSTIQYRVANRNANGTSAWAESNVLTPIVDFSVSGQGVAGVAAQLVAIYAATLTSSGAATAVAAFAPLVAFAVSAQGAATDSAALLGGIYEALADAHGEAGAQAVMAAVLAFSAESHGAGGASASLVTGGIPYLTFATHIRQSVTVGPADTRVTLGIEDGVIVRMEVG